LEIPSLAARRPYSLTGKTSFYDVPTSQFTHFVHELASSTSQSLLGTQSPNPCPRAFTNLFHTNVYLVFFFFFSTFKVHLNILLPVSFTMCPTSLNFNNNSVSYPQNNLCSTSSSLIQFRSTYSHFHSRPITHVFYRYRLTLVSNIQRGKLFNVIYNLLQHSSIFHIFITAYYISSLYNFIYILLYLSRGTTAKKKRRKRNKNIKRKRITKSMATRILPPLGQPIPSV